MTKYVVTTDVLQIKGHSHRRGSELDLPNDDLSGAELSNLVDRDALKAKSDASDEDVIPAAEAPREGDPRQFPAQPEDDPNRVVAPAPEPLRAPPPEGETVMEPPGQRQRQRTRGNGG